MITSCSSYINTHVSTFLPSISEVTSQSLVKKFNSAHKSYDHHKKKHSIVEEFIKGKCYSNNFLSVLKVIVNCTNDEGVTLAALATLGAKARISVRTVIRAIQRFVFDGLLKVSKRGWQQTNTIEVVPIHELYNKDAKLACNINNPDLNLQDRDLNYYSCRSSLSLFAEYEKERSGAKAPNLGAVSPVGTQDRPMSMDDLTKNPPVVVEANVEIETIHETEADKTDKTSLIAPELTPNSPRITPLIHPELNLKPNSLTEGKKPGIIGKLFEIGLTLDDVKYVLFLIKKYKISAEIISRAFEAIKNASGIRNLGKYFCRVLMVLYEQFKINHREQEASMSKREELGYNRSEKPDSSYNPRNAYPNSNQDNGGEKAKLREQKTKEMFRQAEAQPKEPPPVNYFTNLKAILTTH